GLNGKPQVKNLKEILEEWLVCRRSVVTRRVQFRLDKIDKRLHILAGLLIAYLHIDEVIRIIREEDDPKATLMQNYDLTEIQANAILDIRLRQLAKLEEIELRREQDELAAERAKLQEYLDNPESLTALIIDELTADMKEHGNERMSPLMERDEAQALKESDLIPSEPITAILSKAGWIRAAKGHEVDAKGMTYRSGDGYQADVRGKSNEKIYVLDSTGRSYSIEAHNLASARGQGDPLTSVLKPPAGASFEQLLTGSDEQRIILASSKGYGFINRLGNLDTNQKSGKNLINLAADSRLLPVARIDASAGTNGDDSEAVSTIPDHVAVVTNAGYLLIFALDDLPEQARGKGNKMITLKGDEEVLAITPLSLQDSLVITAGKRHVTLKPMDLANYTGTRGNRGGQLPRGFQNVTGVEVG
ncbi:DNA gyrase subunit A, partial [Psychrobacter sp. T6-1]